MNLFITITFLLQDSENDTIYHSELFTLTKKMARGIPTKISFNIPIFEPHPPQYYIRAVSDSWLHAESLFTVSFHNLTLPQVNVAIAYISSTALHSTIICWILHVFPADTNNTHWTFGLEASSTERSWQQSVWRSVQIYPFQSDTNTGIFWIPFIFWFGCECYVC
jgi:hypothetical protein